jgi:hypothetical protein
MSAGGRVDVFWPGTDHRLWHTSRGPRTGWRRPAGLHLGPVRGGLFGVAGRGGLSEVFWRGRAGHLWFAGQRRDGHWSGPHDLGGHLG